MKNKQKRWGMGFIKYLIFLLFVGCSYSSGMSISEACTWVNENIEYKGEAVDEWKHPIKTLEDRNGDCEDMAVLILYLARDIEAMLSVVKTEEGHAVVRKNNYFYDGTSGKVYHKSKWKIIQEYTLLEAEAMCIFY